MGGKSQPAAPDYSAAAREQGVANVQAAIANARLNNPNIVTPFGTYSSQQTGSQNIPGYGDIPTFTQTLDLDPRADTAINQVWDTVSTPFAGDDVIKAAENAYLSRLEPQLARAREARTNELSVRGFKPGSTTYQVEEELARQQENDARATAIANAGPAISQAMALRSQPINELTALMSGSQVGIPQFQGANIGAAPIMGASQLQGQHGLDVYNAKNAQMGSLVGAGASLGGAYLMATAI